MKAEYLWENEYPYDYYKNFKINSSKFSALPSGSCGFGTFNDFGLFASWWSSTEDVENKNNAINEYIGYNSWDDYRGGTDKSTGHSIRCIKN